MPDEMKVAPWTEMWVKAPCPYCNEANWVCQGDPADPSGVDIAVVKCRKKGCKKDFALTEDWRDFDGLEEDGVADPT